MKKKALISAVTLGLLLGSYGNASAENMGAVYGAGTTPLADEDEYKGTNITAKDGQYVTINGKKSCSNNNEFTVTGKDGNSLIIFGGYNYGYRGGRDATGNKVIIKDTLSVMVYGGNALYSEIEFYRTNAINNTVIIYGGSFLNYSEMPVDPFFIGIVGGFSYSGSSEGNTVTVLGGEVPAKFMDIDLDTETGFPIYGGHAELAASDNTVNLGGYKEDDRVITDSTWKVSANYTAYGGYSKSGQSSNNTLNVFSVGNSIRSIGMCSGANSFQNMNFYIPKTAVNGDTMLNIKDALDMTGVANVNVGVQQGSNLVAGDTINLIKDEAGITNYSAKVGKPRESEFTSYETSVALSPDNKALVATIKGNGSDDNEQSKSPVETMAAGISMLTNGGDMIANEAFGSASDAIAAAKADGSSKVDATAGNVNVLTPFVVIGGANTRINSGSHVDLKSWNVNVGFAKEIENSSGKLLIGPVVEYGHGSYDSYLDNGMHGTGNSSFWGLGVIAKQTNNNNFYYEGSLRAGRISNDYRADSVYGSSYDIKSTYYATHVGAGKIFDLNEKDSLDVYGKLFYTHQNGANTQLAAYNLELKAVDSFRTRIGTRYNHKVNPHNTLYTGLAWQYEFSGKAEAVYNGHTTPSPSVKGHTGILELGWKGQPGNSDNFEVDLGVKGYTGVQRGASVNALFNWKF